MTRFTSSVFELSKHPAVLLAAAIATVVQLLLWFFEAMGKVPKMDWSHNLITHGVFISAGFVCLGFLFVSRDLQRLKRSFAKIHDVNHLYRNALAETSAKLFELESGMEDQKRKTAVNKILGEVEVATIDRVVSIVATQFQMLINRPVVVTFWKIDDEGKSCIEQETSANGIDASRPFRVKQRFSLQHNSIFCDNRDKKGKCCHFFSPDLEETAGHETGYQDERPNHLQFYKSILCVPIRFCWKIEEDAPLQQDLLGYIQVDAQSRNRLNNAEHLYLLSAYADQLYNFLSIVRRNFILS